MAREVVAKSLGCGAVLTDDEQSTQWQLGVGEHAYRVRSRPPRTQRRGSLRSGAIWPAKKPDKGAPPYPNEARGSRKVPQGRRAQTGGPGRRKRLPPRYRWLDCRPLSTPPTALAGGPNAPGGVPFGTAQGFLGTADCSS